LDWASRPTRCSPMRAPQPSGGCRTD
jgi:hypothetical protein